MLKEVMGCLEMFALDEENVVKITDLRGLSLLGEVLDFLGPSPEEKEIRKIVGKTVTNLMHNGAMQSRHHIRMKRNEEVG